MLLRLLRTSDEYLGTFPQAAGNHRTSVAPGQNTKTTAAISVTFPVACDLPVPSAAARAGGEHRDRGRSPLVPRDSAECRSIDRRPRPRPRRRRRRRRRRAAAKNSIALPAAPAPAEATGPLGAPATARVAGGCGKPQRQEGPDGDAARTVRCSSAALDTRTRTGTMCGKWGLADAVGGVF